MNYKFKVPFSYVDCNLNLSYYNTCILISDAVCDFLELNNFDNSIFSYSHSALWVVLKNKIIIRGTAKYKDILDIDVNYVEIKKLYTIIEVNVFKDSNILYKAYVTLGAISTFDHSLLDIGNLNILPLNENKVNVYTHFKNSLDGFDFLFNYKVKKEDIDFSNHLNNLIYIKILLEKIENPKSIEIHYLKEVKLNDIINVYVKKEESSLYFIIYTDTFNAKGKIVL